MSNRSLLSLNNQEMHGNVRRLSQKFENLFELNEDLSSPKSQLFISLPNKKQNTHVLTTRSNTDALNEKSTSIINSLLSNKELIRIFKQIFVGGSVGTFAGSLLGQTSQLFFRYHVEIRSCLRM